MTHVICAATPNTVYCNQFNLCPPNVLMAEIGLWTDICLHSPARPGRSGPAQPGPAGPASSNMKVGTQLPAKAVGMGLFAQGPKCTMYIVGGRGPPSPPKVGGIRLD